MPRLHPRAGAVAASVLLVAATGTLTGAARASTTPTTRPGSSTTRPTTTTRPRTTPTTKSPGTSTTTTPIPPVPSPWPVGPGGSVAWTPAGRSVVNQPALYLGQHGGAQMAWMPPKLVRAVVVPGAGDPGGPWPWGGQVEPASQGLLVASFNGGFKWSDFNGGVFAFGHGFRALVPGVASFVVFADGSFTVGEWGRDVNVSPYVVAVRQNLGMLVDGGAPTPAAGSPGAWGASVAGVATARSGVGVDANGGLVWAGGRLSPADLAAALVAGGAVRGMQMDINPSWVNFNLYQPDQAGFIHGAPVYGATGPDRYLTPNSRDFIVVVLRGTAVPGPGFPIGAPPLHTQLTVR